MSNRDRKIMAAVAAGLSVIEAAAVLGLCRSSAYSLASRLRLVSSARLAEAKRRQVLRLIAQGASLAAIAAQVGVGKTTVLRVRDRAAARATQDHLRRFGATRSVYVCQGCGRRIRIAPCVICAARGESCHAGE